MVKHQPAPKTTYEPSREHIELNKLREMHHRQAMNKLSQTRSLSFHHLQTEKSMKTRQKQAKILEDAEQTLQFDRFRANSIPKAQVDSSPL